MADDDQVPAKPLEETEFKIVYETWKEARSSMETLSTSATSIVTGFAGASALAGKSIGGIFDASIGAQVNAWALLLFFVLLAWIYYDRMKSYRRVHLDLGEVLRKREIKDRGAKQWLRKDLGMLRSYRARLWVPIGGLLVLWLCIADVPEYVIQRLQGPQEAPKAAEASCPSCAQAQTVEYAAPQSVALVYHGTGCRVHAGGERNTITLYLPRLMTKPQEIVESDVVKRLDVKMAETETKSNVVRTLTERYLEVAQHLGLKKQDIEPKIEQLFASFTPELVHRGEELRFTYLPGGYLTFGFFDDKQPPRAVQSRDLMRVIFTSFLGDDAIVLHAKTSDESLGRIRTAFLAASCGGACKNAPIQACAAKR